MTTNKDLAINKAINNAINIAEEIERMQQVLVSACRQEFPKQTAGHSEFNASALQQKLKIHTENYSELVTAVDINLSKIILAAARESLPQSYSEEELPTEPCTADLLWQIDPIDGTDESAQGLTHFWDVSAAQPIIEALGGFVCDLTGQEISYNKSNKVQDQFNRQGFIASIVFSKEQILPEDTAALLLRRLD